MVALLLARGATRDVKDIVSTSISTQGDAVAVCGAAANQQLLLLVCCYFYGCSVLLCGLSRQVGNG